MHDGGEDEDGVLGTKNGAGLTSRMAQGHVIGEYVQGRRRLGERGRGHVSKRAGGGTGGVIAARGGAARVGGGTGDAPASGWEGDGLSRTNNGLWT